MLTKDVYNLTSSQNSIWVTEQYYKGTSINNICGSAIIQEKINFDYLKKAIQIVVKKHDGFWLKFKIKDSELIQYLDDKRTFNIETIKLKDEKDLTNVINKIAKTPLELEDSVLFKFYLVEFNDGHGGFIPVTHHLITDGWSFALISNEVINTYSQLIENKEVKSNSIYSYLDYIQSEKEYLKSEKFIKDKAYWDDLFQEVPEVASIPGSKSNSNSSSCEANREKFKLTSKTVSDLKNYCKENKISLYNFFMAIYSIYIGEITNLNDFVIGTPILNRSNFKEKHALGMFVNMVPFKINLDENLEFKTFIKQISSNSMGMLKHQKYSYQHILENIREKNKNIPNLYNIILSYQISNAHQYGDNLNYTTNWVFNGCCANDIDIQLYDTNDEKELTISYDYKKSKYSKSDILNMHNRILHIIEQVILSENIKLSDIDIITQKEKNEILEINKMNYNKNIPLISYFENQVKKTPNTIAMVFENKTMSYKDLNEKANSLACVLKSKGIKNNTIVGIIQDRSFEMIIAILAVLKAGGAYIPIDPNYPFDRIKYMLSDSNCKLLLGENIKVYSDIESININLSNDLYNYNSDNLINISKPDDLAYLIYTSGSTGKPKGVMIKQQNLSNFYNSIISDIEYLSLNKNLKIGSITTVSFDIFVFETLISLCCGLTLYMTNNEEQKLTKLLENLIYKNKIEILQTTPSVFNFHLDNIADINNLYSLKYLMLAGEPLSKSLVDKIKKLLPNITIYNGYGPSETTIFASTKNVTDSKHISIGKPVANSNIYVLNKNNKLLPKGVIGELFISGDCVGKGYINNEKRTNLSFINDLFYPDQTMYASGDLGYYNSDNDLICSGRIDNQIKIHGLRVELSEIENIIASIPNITNVIAAKKTINNRDCLCAYYTESKPVNITIIKRKLIKKLPLYMVPQYIIKLEKFYYTPNGKIDKKMLPEPQLNEVKTKKINPENDIDKKLLNIVSTILQNKNINLADTLIDLGGDSLSAITIATKISSTFNVPIYIKELLSNKSLKEISNIILYNKNKGIEKIKIEKCENRDFYPLSSAQKRIYYNSKMIGNNNLVYNMPGAILCDEILDKNKVKEAFQKIIKRHTILATSFIIKNNEVVQKINDNIDFNIKVFNNSNDEINSIISSFSRPFDLEKDLLLRIELHYIDNKKTLLLLDSHHIIMDGTSLNNLIVEFTRLYNNENLKNLPIQYKDYSVWENSFNSSENILKYEKYWLNKFKNSDFTQLDLPYDYKQLSKRSYNGKTYSSIIDKDLFNKFENKAKQLGVSPYVFFLSALFILLYKYTQQEEIILGSPISNRDINETKRMLGMFVNNIVVKANIRSENTYLNFLNNIKEQVLEDLSKQPYPFDLLVKKLDIKTDNSRNPLFDIMFTYQSNENNLIQINNKKANIININNNIAKFNLSVEIKPQSHIINLEYCTDLFKEESISKMFNNYLNILTTLLNDDTIKIKDIKMITELEENKILNNFNQAHSKIINKQNAITIFNEMVNTYPNNIAVQINDEYLTYKQLDEKANFLANSMLDLGVKHGDVVGIHLHRSIELIISMLATLKIGAIYMPIYIEYPKDRIEYMLNDSNAKLLITNQNIFDIKFKGKILSLNSYYNIKNSIKFNGNSLYESSSLAYIIYTSGSTGRPKGVQVTHNNLINFIKAFIKYYDNEVGPNDNFLSSTNISFDVSIWEFFLPLLTGAKLVLYKEDIIKDIFEYTNSIENYNITALYIPPNILEDVYNILKNKNNINIDKMLVGVEPIRKKVLNKYFLLNKNIKIVNGYGPSETTICCTALRYYEDNSDGIVSIGKPLINNNIYILNKDKNLQSIGIPGEIYVTGAGVGNGYINNPTETSKNFLNNFMDKTSQKIYKTGDIAQWNLDGTIKFIGRNDSQVKISGHRIELNEINQTIMLYPSIVKSHTLIQKQGEHNIIISYFISEKKVSKTDLNSFLRERLTDYMIPNFMIQLKSFPLTPNGKIDKKKLPTNFELKNNYIAPRNDFEKKLENIFKKLFILDKVGIDDNFFDLGGDSLIAIKFQIEAINSGLHLTYSDIFENPTIRMLSERKSKDLSYNINNDYDFSKINNLLNKNVIANIPEKIENKKIENVLLIGSTGFLGSHILDELIENGAQKIYCLVRAKFEMTPEYRLKKNLQFYFGNKYDDLIGSKIIVINGDITQKNLGLSNEQFNNLSSSIDICIHTAAIVKHYGDFKMFNNTNVEGTINVINLCKKYNKKLYYISTLSVSGNLIKDSEKDTNVEYKEKDFFIGQDLNNIYIYTKFEAEKRIFEAIEDGLQACILRIGNITNRYSDGKFQINVSENAFISRIKSILNLGVIQNKFLEHFLEFTPVDACASSIVKIIKSNPTFTVFHLFNNNLIQIKNLITILNEVFKPIKPVSDDEFKNKIQLALNDINLKTQINGIITDLDDDNLLDLINHIIPNCDFTLKYLNSIGFKWPIIDEEYITKYIEYFKNIKYL